MTDKEIEEFSNDIVNLLNNADKYLNRKNKDIMSAEAEALKRSNLLKGLNKFAQSGAYDSPTYAELKKEAENLKSNVNDLKNKRYDRYVLRTEAKRLSEAFQTLLILRSRRDAKLAEKGMQVIKQDYLNRKPTNAAEELVTQNNVNARLDGMDEQDLPHYVRNFDNESKMSAYEFYKLRAISKTLHNNDLKTLLTRYDAQNHVTEPWLADEDYQALSKKKADFNFIEKNDLFLAGPNCSANEVLNMKGLADDVVKNYTVYDEKQRQKYMSKLSAQEKEEFEDLANGKKSKEEPEKSFEDQLNIANGEE